MQVIEYFSAENPGHWLSKIKESDWVAGQFLYRHLRDDQYHAYAGQNAKILLLTHGDELISFCTLTDKDDIEPTDLTPWIGFVYTFPQYRGNHYAGKLLDYAADLVKAKGLPNVFLSTDQPGIYEHYGFSYLDTMKDMRGGESMVYVRSL